jgi:hypothetical protein
MQKRVKEGNANGRMKERHYTHLSFVWRRSEQANDHIKDDRRPEAEECVVHVMEVSDHPRGVVLLTALGRRVDEVE